ncbi:hypothetical protein WA158_007198 [Blastocystis sp. Blastoise]
MSDITLEQSIQRPDKTKMVNAQIDSLNMFLNESKETFTKLLKEFHCKDRLQSPEDYSDYVRCPIDSSHLIPSSSYDNHMYRCHKISAKYGVESHSYSNSIPDSLITGSKVESHNISGDVNDINPNDINDEELIDKSDERLIVDDDLIDELTSLINPTVSISIESLCQKDLLDFEKEIQLWKLIPFSLLHISIRDLDQKKIRSYIVTLMEKYCVVFDTDLVTFIYMCIYQDPSTTPDSIVKQLYDFFGSKTNSFVLSLWKFLIKLSVIKKRKELIDQGKLSINTQPTIEHNIQMSTNTISTNINNDNQLNDPSLFLSIQHDYKRRRQTYRGKMTHITRMTFKDQLRDFINRKMLMLHLEKGYTLLEPPERLITKNMKKEIEAEERAKNMIPKENQFTDIFASRKEALRRYRNKH